MRGLYALLGMGGLMCALGHWIMALPVFLGLLFADHHPEESVFTPPSSHGGGLASRSKGST